MINRWTILAVLFFVRTTMAFQFQSVAALSPFMIETLLLTLVEIGILIGLYLGPGVIVAVLGGTLASVLGDRRTVLGALLFMFLGSVIVMQAQALEMHILGRVLSGVGGVIVNVVMTKMVIDWFAGREVATAMSLFLSSWPMGIALALVVLPPLADQGGLAAGWMGVTVLTGTAFFLFWLIYRTAPNAAAYGRITVVDLPWLPLAMAALIWGFYNAALAMVFGFGPIILTDKGLSAADASAATSIFMFVIVAAAPLGGWFVDRYGHRDLLILMTLVIAIILLPLMASVPVGQAWLYFAIGGFLIGLSPGSIVSMTSQILPPEARAFGTGVYYAVYYLVMMLAPPFAGSVAERSGDMTITFTLGAALMGLCIMALAYFRHLTRVRG